MFRHVLTQPIAFFTRAQTGSLVSRLNADVIGAQQAFTSVLSSVVSNAVSLVLIVAGYLIYLWRYRIDETFYAQLVADLRERGQLT